MSGGTLSRQRAIAGSLLLSVVIRLAKAQDLSTVDIALDASILNDLIPSLRNDFFPGLISTANIFTGPDLTAIAQVGSCCGLGDFGVKAEARVFNFRLDELTDSQIAVESVPLASTKARLRIKASDLRLSVSASASVGAAFGVGLSCSIGATATVFLPSITIGVDVSTVQNTGSIIFDTAGELAIPAPLVILTPVIDNACSLVAASVAIVFNTLSLTLSALLAPFFTDKVFPHFLSGLIGDVDNKILTIGNHDPFNVFNTARITPLLNLQRFQAGNNELRIRGAGSYAATLTAPAYRAGRSWAPAIIRSVPLLIDTVLGSLVRLHLR